MGLPLSAAETVSVTDAAKRGVPTLVRDAHSGHDVVVERHGTPWAAVIGIDRFTQLQEFERDLGSTALVIARMATDNGQRRDLNDVITMLGFDRGELDAELDADIAAGRA